MAADESLSRYQLGKYLFTRERIMSGAEWADDNAMTNYKMYRDPNEAEWNQEPDFAPARDVGTLTVSHHPREDVPPQVTRRVVGNVTGMAKAREGLPQREHGSEAGGRVVASRGWHERYSPSDEVHLLTVAKESRTMMPTLLALGQRAAKETTGQDLRASEDLSVHSQRIVDRFKEAGMVPRQHESSRNTITFPPAIPTAVPGGLEGFLSVVQQRKQRSEMMHERYGTESDMEEPIPLPDVERAKQRGARDRPSGATEAGQLMPQPKDMGPDVMTEEERLAHRRFEAYFAFESEWQPKKNLSDDQFDKVPDGS